MLINRVAILDNGIYQKQSDGLIINKIIEKNVVREWSDADSLLMCEHGTYCSLIIKKYTGVVSLYGIRILDENGKGDYSNLYQAFDECNREKIYLLNLSFGTTHFQDKKAIRKTINHFSNQGFLIIAATSNDGYTTYPASLSNVISVSAGDSFGIDQNMQLQKGIDFIAPSKHEITIEGASFCLGKSNSYAAPYVTAMVGNLINEKGMLTIDEIRMRLAPEGTAFMYSPDWIEKACISTE